LFEVDQIPEKDVYEVTDYEEELLLLEALEGDNPILSETEIDKTRYSIEIFLVRHPRQKSLI
jgi:hypothetical protein